MSKYATSGCGGCGYELASPGISYHHGMYRAHLIVLCTPCGEVMPDQYETGVPESWRIYHEDEGVKFRRAISILRGWREQEGATR